MYAIYLRKSRADAEAESRGEGETLARHRGVLLNLAKHKNAEIGEIYTEIVSGESLASRPKMQKLLCDVEQKKWTGVFVMEIERLCRGNSIDQGIVAQAFKESGTLIITPNKTYDPNNEFDEEYFEFSLFMSRREYKTINRRMAAGKRAAALEGKFIGSRAPYGYKKVRIKEGCSLEAAENEESVLKCIFDWYANENMGVCKIANRLNAYGIAARTGGKWSASSIRDILKNPIYIGKIRTKDRIVEGLHESIISEYVFEKAQKKKKSVPISKLRTLSNPFAGIIQCGECGKNMLRRENKSRNAASILCPYTYCKNVSSYFEVVENSLLCALSAFYKCTELPNISDEESKNKELLAYVEEEIKQSNLMLERIYLFAERGIYTDDEYIKRRKSFDAHMQMLEKAREELVFSFSKNDEMKMPIGFMQYYSKLHKAEQRNEFLKCFLKKAVYKKETRSGKFSLDVFIRCI